MWAMDKMGTADCIRLVECTRDQRHCWHLNLYLKLTSFHFHIPARNISPFSPVQWLQCFCICSLKIFDVDADKTRIVTVTLALTVTNLAPTLTPILTLFYPLCSPQIRILPEARHKTLRRRWATTLTKYDNNNTHCSLRQNDVGGPERP